MPDLIQALPKGFPPVLWLLLLLTSAQMAKAKYALLSFTGLWLQMLSAFCGKYNK